MRVRPNAGTVIVRLRLGTQVLTRQAFTNAAAWRYGFRTVSATTSGVTCGLTLDNNTEVTAACNSVAGAASATLTLPLGRSIVGAFIRVPARHVDVRIDQVMLRSDGGPVSPPLPSNTPLDHVEACPEPPPVVDAGVQDAWPSPCYDGTDLTCGEPESQCPGELYAAIQNLCWVCVDRKTCQVSDAG